MSPSDPHEALPSGQRPPSVETPPTTESMTRRGAISLVVLGALGVVGGGLASMGMLPRTQYINAWELWKSVDAQLDLEDGGASLSRPVPAIRDGALSASFLVWTTTIVPGHPKRAIRPHLRVYASPLDGRVQDQVLYAPRSAPSFFDRLPAVERVEGDAFRDAANSVERNAPLVWHEYLHARNAFLVDEDATLQAAKHLIEFRMIVSEDAFPFYVAEAPDFFAWLLEMHEKAR